VDSAAYSQARTHRSRLDGVTFVGITGSCGKTTTKDLAAGLLAPVLWGTSNPGSGNCGADLVRQILQVDQAHAFCIQELGAWGPRTLDAGLELVRPDIGVVLNVRRDHYSGFRGLEGTAAEKAKVVACLPADGTAILNADDPLVAAMRARTRARVVTFGAGDPADLRAEHVHGAWPDRLSFDLRFQGGRRRVQTQLLGEHLAGSALAALAIMHALDVPLDAAVDRLAVLPPTHRRMSASLTRSGVAVVRDDFKAASDSLGELLRFVATASAPRTILVVGQVSDYPGRSRPIYTSFADAAAKVADLLVFVGDRPEALWGGARRRAPGFLAEFGGQRARVALFATVRDASRFLENELKPGDLLVLKGSGATDHLERIVLTQEEEVGCWRAQCGLVTSCDDCARLGEPAGPGDALTAAALEG